MLNAATGLGMIQTGHGLDPPSTALLRGYRWSLSRSGTQSSASTVIQGPSSRHDSRLSLQEVKEENRTQRGMVT